MTLYPRLLSLQRASAAFLPARALNSTTRASPKGCCRTGVDCANMNIHSVSRRFLRRAPARREVTNATKLQLRYGLALGLIPVGVTVSVTVGVTVGVTGSGYLVLDCVGAGITVGTLGDLRHWFPSRLKARCQSTVVTKAVAQYPRESVSGSVAKIVSRVGKNLALFAQLVKLCATFGPLLALYPLSLLHRRLYSLWLSALFHVVTMSGPVYVKLGQWASTRRDLFSTQFCQLFSQLHYNVRVHAWRHTERALRAAYGRHWNLVLKVDRTQKPLGSGCVAQVMSWTLARVKYA